MEVGHTTDSESVQPFFDSEKLKVFLVLLTGFEPSTFGSPVQRSTNWATPSPRKPSESEYESESVGYLYIYLSQQWYNRVKAPFVGTGHIIMSQLMKRRSMSRSWYLFTGCWTFWLELIINNNHNSSNNNNNNNNNNTHVNQIKLNQYLLFILDMHKMKKILWHIVISPALE